jgi:DNA polymerase-3 subunit epsilon
VEIAGDVASRLAGAVLVAHNLQFDRDFLAAEFSSAGIFLPEIPGLCTLKLSYRLHPELPNHRLGTCCEAARISDSRVHSAIGDAKATAGLLVRYLDAARRSGVRSLADLGCCPDRFPLACWPSLPCSGRVVVRAAPAAPVVELPFLARLVASLESEPTMTERTAPYFDLLDRVLEDRLVTGAEAQALHDTARGWGLSREEVIAAHHAYLESLVTAALADGRVSEVERRDLEAVTSLLAVDHGILTALLGRLAALVPPLEERRSVMPTDSLAGKTVCFTGALAGRLEGSAITRDLAHQLAIAAGLSVSARVTKATDILVVADPNTQSSKARQARRLGTRVMAEAAFWRAIGIQEE